MKKIISIGVLIAMLLSLFSCDNTPAETENPAGTDTGTSASDNTSTDSVTTEGIITDEPAVFYEPNGRDPLKLEDVKITTDWTDSVNKARALQNGVQGWYTDASRNSFAFSNKSMIFTYALGLEDKLITSLSNASGVPYVQNTGDAFVTNIGSNKLYASGSATPASMNTFRIGYYYYDVHLMNQSFSQEALNISGEGYDIISNTTGKWKGNMVTDVTSKDGVISYKVDDTTDPFILNNGVKFSATKYNTVKITVKTEYASNVDFYIVAGSHTFYTADQVISFAVKAGEWCTVYVPIDMVADYAGNVTGFRVDCGAAAGEKIEIKELVAYKADTAAAPVKLERIYHTYPDKLHEELRYVAERDWANPGSVGVTYVIPAATVRKMILKNSSGETSILDGFDFSSVEYVAFDVKNAGIIGFIMPKLTDNGTLSVELKDGSYIVTREKTVGKDMKKGDDISFGHRIYTDETHQFNAFRKEAYIERNPLTDIFIYEQSDHAKALGYNAITGSYAFSVDGTDFNPPYYNTPNKYYKVNTVICGDGVTDRTVYLKAATPSGCLECAVVMDENKSLLPVSVQVCKNFCGEIEMPFFYPDDISYGEAYFPITVGADEAKKLSVYHLYQKWGKSPLKQLSSIQFHISYYHLSVGVTETNCIAPYFVYGKDAWTLPDFRALSSPLWAGQPQHTSAGRLYFLQYTDKDGTLCKSESKSALINSAGPAYADIDMSYLSDDGKIKAEYRHLEMPQTDETRTYYQIKLTVLDDIAIENFKRDFSFFSFDGRAIFYKKLGYLDENDVSQIKTVSTAKDFSEYIKLGKTYPYYDYFGNAAGTDSVNFGLIVKNSDITIGGKKYTGNFILRNEYKNKLNYGALTLDLESTVLKKGDTLILDIILLPWGQTSTRTDDSVRNVRNDSCINPFKLNVTKGEVINDVYLPKIKAENNTASFTLSGGENSAAVRIYGFTSYSAPKITETTGGREKEYTVSVMGGDGYQVYCDGDGTYSIAFSINMTGFKERSFTVTQ